MDESSKQTNEDRPDEISTDYANNFAIEGTLWDLKALFGEYSGRSKSVEWHTEITMPWATAKLLAHYLQVNVAIYEIENGKVRIPPSAIPAPPPPAREGDRAAQAVFNMLKEHWDRFVASLTEKPAAE
jgi:hypothetical protein